jgi:IrrE N-terminal-like domain
MSDYNIIGERATRSNSKVPTLTYNVSDNEKSSFINSFCSFRDESFLNNFTFDFSTNSSFEASAPRTLLEIEKLASNLRIALGVNFEEKIDIVSIVQFDLTELIPDYRFVILDDDDESVPSRVGAYALARPWEIGIRESIYQKAVCDLALARLIIAHELAHVILHTQPRIDCAGRFVDDFGRSEVTLELEADSFAAAFLIPAGKINCLSADQISVRFGVTRQFAERRLRHLSALRAQAPPGTR